MDNMSNNKEGLVKYIIKYLYPKDQISDEQAKRDFINTIFSHIALTSITNYNVMRKLKHRSLRVKSWRLRRILKLLKVN